MHVNNDNVGRVTEQTLKSALRMFASYSINYIKAIFRDNKSSGLEDRLTSLNYWESGEYLKEAFALSPITVNRALQEVFDTWSWACLGKPKTKTGVKWDERYQKWFTDPATVGFLAYSDGTGVDLLNNNDSLDWADMNSTYPMPFFGTNTYFSSGFKNIRHETMLDLLRKLVKYANTYNNEAVDDLSEINTCNSTLPYNPAEWITKTHEPTKLNLELNKEETKMGKTDNFVNHVQAGTSVGMDFVKGNAVLAAAKAALRPALRASLVKTVTPKSKIAKILGGGKIEETVDAILDSPVMDLVASMVLVGIDSAGITDNKTFKNGVSLANQAAFIKAAGMVDFDGIISAVVGKTGEVVSSVSTKLGNKDE